MEGKWLTWEKWRCLNQWFGGWRVFFTVWKIEFVCFFDMADLVGGNTNLKEIESR